MPRLGAQEKSSSNAQFYVIKHNCICQESKTERPGYEAKEVVNPQTDERLIRYIKPYSSLIGIITDIEWRDTGDRYDQQYVDWRIHLNLGDTNGVLTIPFRSRHSSRFMMLAENIDFKRPVEFRAWYDNKNDSTAFYVGQFVNDDDEKSVSVPQKYRKGEMGDCPEGVQRLGGKWNFDDQTEYLHDRMMRIVIPAVKAANENSNHTPEQPAPTPMASPDREFLIKNVYEVCARLNEANDTIKWASSTLRTFINDTYQVDDGIESLSPEYLVKLRMALEARLVGLDDVPF